MSVKCECECVGVGGSEGVSFGAALLVDVVELENGLWREGEGEGDNKNGAGSAGNSGRELANVSGIGADFDADEESDEEIEGMVVVGHSSASNANAAVQHDTNAAAQNTNERQGNNRNRRKGRVSAAGGLPQPVALLPLTQTEQGGCGCVVCVLNLCASLPICAATTAFTAKTTFVEAPFTH